MGDSATTGWSLCKCNFVFEGRNEHVKNAFLHTAQYVCISSDPTAKPSFKHFFNPFVFYPHVIHPRAHHPLVNAPAEIVAENKQVAIIFNILKIRQLAQGNCHERSNGLWSS